MSTLKQIVEEADTPLGRTFDIAVQCLIVFSLITFSVETLPNLSSRALHFLSIVEVVTVLVFTAEYVLRVFVATNRTQYVSSFFGIVDLVAILPFYLSSGLDLRAVRAFRLLRLARVLKLARYNAAVRRFRVAFGIAKEELVLFLFASAILLYLSAVGIYYFEHDAQPEVFASVIHSLWWAVATLTTVGYGDVYPITAGGKCFTFFTLIIGLGIISVPAGLVASALSKAREMEDEAA